MATSSARVDLDAFEQRAREALDRSSTPFSLRAVCSDLLALGARVRELEARLVASAQRAAATQERASKLVTENDDMAEGTVYVCVGTRCVARGLSFGEAEDLANDLRGEIAKALDIGGAHVR